MNLLSVFSSTCFNCIMHEFSSVSHPTGFTSWPPFLSCPILGNLASLKLKFTDLEPRQFFHKFQELHLQTWEFQQSLQDCTVAEEVVHSSVRRMMSLESHISQPTGLQVSTLCFNPRLSQGLMHMMAGTTAPPWPTCLSKEGSRHST